MQIERGRIDSDGMLDSLLKTKIQLPLLVFLLGMIAVMVHRRGNQVSENQRVVTSEPPASKITGEVKSVPVKRQIDTGELGKSEDTQVPAEGYLSLPKSVHSLLPMLAAPLSGTSLSIEWLEVLELDQATAEKVNGIIAGSFEKIGELEIQNSKLVSGEEGQFIEIPDLTSDAGSLLSKASEELGEIVGKPRAEILRAVLTAEAEQFSGVRRIWTEKFEGQAAGYIFLEQWRDGKRVTQDAFDDGGDRTIRRSPKVIC